MGTLDIEEFNSDDDVLEDIDLTSNDDAVNDDNNVLFGCNNNDVGDDGGSVGDDGDDVDAANNAADVVVVVVVDGVGVGGGVDFDTDNDGDDEIGNAANDADANGNKLVGLGTRDSTTAAVDGS